MEPAQARTAEGPSTADGVMRTIVGLVETGPLALGSFTTAQILAVNGPAPGLPVPEPAVLAEAVRGLVARGLAVPVEGSDEIDVQGDLGLVLTVQKRTRLLVDVVFRGRSEQRPWHLVLLPQAERVTLIDAMDRLGLHHMTMVKTADAVERLRSELPSGKVVAGVAAPAEERAEQSDEAALVSVVRFSDEAPTGSDDLMVLRKGEEVQLLQRTGGSDAPWHASDASSAVDAIRALSAPLLDESVGV